LGDSGFLSRGWLDEVHKVLHELLALGEGIASEVSSDLLEVVSNWEIMGDVLPCDDESWGLLGCLDLEEGMWVIDFTLTGLTVVEILTDAALIACSNQGECIASVASHSGVNCDLLRLGLRVLHEL